MTTSLCGFPLLSRLGTGTYGVVYSIQDADQKRALKVIGIDIKDVASITSPQIKVAFGGPHVVSTRGLEGTLNEVDIMSRVNHPHLMPALQIVGQCHGGNNLIGIMMPLGVCTLADLIPHVQFSPIDRVKILYQVTTGTAFLHSVGILHLDIKPTNILLFLSENEATAVLSDFSLALYVDNAREGRLFNQELVTVTYRPPEILRGGRIYNSAVDVWSLGILFLLVLSCRDIFAEINFTSQSAAAEVANRVYAWFGVNRLENVRSLIPTYPLPMITLISSMLHPDNRERATLDTVIDVFKVSGYGSYVRGEIKTMNYTSLTFRASTEHYTAVAYITKICMRYGRILAETFYLAVDLFHRTIPYRQVSDATYTAVTAIWVASRMLEDEPLSIHQLKEITGINHGHVSEVEMAIVNSTHGILYRPTIYTASTDLADLIFGLQAIGMADYLQLDFVTWLPTVRRESSFKGGSKKVRFGELISAARTIYG